MPVAYSVPLLTKASCSMANPRRAKSLMELAEEDLVGARKLLDVSTRLARYHVQQCAEKAVKALFEHRNLNPGREHRFGMLAQMLPQNDEWVARVNNLDAFFSGCDDTPLSSSGRPHSAAARTPPKKVISLPPDQPKPVDKKAVLSEHERKSALAKRIVSIARLKELEMPDNVEEKLAIYVDERTLSGMLKEIQTDSSFQDILDAHSITIPRDDNN